MQNCIGSCLLYLNLIFGKIIAIVSSYSQFIAWILIFLLTNVKKKNDFAK